MDYAHNLSQRERKVDAVHVRFCAMYSNTHSANVRPCNVQCRAAFSCVNFRAVRSNANLIAAATIIDAGGLVRCRPMRFRALSTAAGASRTAASATYKLRDCAPMPSRFTGAVCCDLRPSLVTLARSAAGAIAALSGSTTAAIPLGHRRRCHGREGWRLLSAYCG